MTVCQRFTPLSVVTSTGKRVALNAKQATCCQCVALSLFVQTVLLPRNIHNAACHAMLSLLFLVDLIVATARLTVSPARLLAAVHFFLKAYVDAFGEEWLIPKCHWLLRLAETLKRFGNLLNCFCLERKHRWPKRYATDLQNTSQNASASLLSEVVCQHIASLAAPGAFDFEVGLTGGRAAPKKSRR